ncbi:hypothetical protein MHYP_G00342710 [Metynnis hypsauchen]
MLIKVKHRGTKKYVKLEEAIFSEFISAVRQKFLIPEKTVLKVTDEQSIEVDEDVFPELAAVKEVCFVIYTDDDILPAESSKDTAASSSLTDYVTLTPCVEQILTSKSAGVTVLKEYEETGSLKDSTRRLMVNVIVAHMREKEGRAVSKATKEFHALGIVSLFPSLKDPYSKKGYILQDFLLMFGMETASKFLEKWNMSFKDKIIREAKVLKETALLKKHLISALNEESDTADEPEWDSDMASLIVLLHLLTPQPAGRKRPKKISVGEAIDHLVKFHKSCHSLEDHLMSTEGNTQPYLLATGTSKA